VNEKYIIMITANPGARHRVYAETSGADKYLNKPFDMKDLVDYVADRVELRSK